MKTVWALVTVRNGDRLSDSEADVYLALYENRRAALKNMRSSIRNEIDDACLDPADRKRYCVNQHVKAEGYGSQTKYTWDSDYLNLYMELSARPVYGELATSWVGKVYGFLLIPLRLLSRLYGSVLGRAWAL